MALEAVGNFRRELGVVRQDTFPAEDKVNIRTLLAQQASGGEERSMILMPMQPARYPDQQHVRPQSETRPQGESCFRVRAEKIAINSVVNDFHL